MKKLYLISAFVSCILVTFIAESATFDLQADWSDINNPNGTWSYNDGGGAITNHVDNYLPGVFATPQPAWVNAASGPGHIVSWFKSVNNTFDWLSGDVITHTWDGASSGGVSTPHSNLTWTSPSAGTIDISGAVWLARNIGRSVDWTLSLNSATLTSGSLFDGDIFDRNNPSDFLGGTGGVDVLNGISVVAGDQITLSLITTSTFGEFTGVDLNIQLAAVPAPPAVWLFGSGLIGLISIARRKKS